MRPHVLIVGLGKGSFAVRGRQLGRAIGARVSTEPMAEDLAWADVVVLVKRAILVFGREAQQAGKAIVWDALDFWSQPAQNGLDDASALALYLEHIQTIRPVLTIGATRAMAGAVGGTYLPHHHRPGLIPAAVRPVMTTVAYEGTRKYLGSWGKAIQTACDRLGLQFLINPLDLREADLVVSFRGEEWDGPICRQWKSGVKIVNAMAAGRPILSQPCAAFSEIQPSGDVVDSLSDIEASIAAWQPLERRTRALIECRARASEFALDTVARHYHSILSRMMAVAA